MIGQPVVERSFFSRLQTTQVLFDTRCVAVDESSSDSVTVTTDNRDHPAIRARYVVGADGARSTVRGLLGIGFAGTKPEMVWTVLDTFIDTDFPRADEIVTFQCNGQSRVSWIPRERGMARFYSLLDPDQDKNQENSEAFIREHMRPHRIDFVKTEWFSTFESESFFLPNLHPKPNPHAYHPGHALFPPSIDMSICMFIYIHMYLHDYLHNVHVSRKHGDIKADMGGSVPNSPQQSRSA